MGEPFDNLMPAEYNNSIQTSEVDAMAFNQSQYITDYVKENYDRIELRVPKGKRVILKQLAKQYNVTDDKGKISVGRLMIEAVEEKYHVDLSRPEST